MKILHLCESRCAGAPETLSNCLQTVPGIYSDRVVIPRKEDVSTQYYSLALQQLLYTVKSEHIDILHWHQCFNKDVFEKTRGLKHILHYHGGPDMTFATDTKHGRDLHKSVSLVVCAHYHPVHESYKLCTPIRNITRLGKQVPVVLDTQKLSKKIKFISSFTKDIPGAIWQKKGAQEMRLVMEMLRDNVTKQIVYTAAENVKHDVLMTAKAEHDIVLDECVTPGFHLSGIEGLSLGKPVICWVDQKVEDMIKKITGASNHPFHGDWIGWLPEYLERYIQDPDTIRQHGIDSYKWFIKYWHPKDILQDYINLYNK